MNNKLYYELYQDFSANIKNRADELIALLDKYEITDKRDSTDLAGLITIFLNAKCAEGLANTTINTYKSTLNRFARFANGQSISKEIIRSYLASLASLKGNTIAQHLRRIQIFYNWCQNEGYVHKNPSMGLVYKSSKVYRHAIPDSDLNLIKDQCKKLYDQTLVEVLVKTGCRVSEIVNMRIEDIDFNENTIRVTGKGNKIRTVLFDDTTAALLRQHLQQQQGKVWVFSSTRAPYGQLQRFAIEKRIKRIGIAAGLKYNLHPHLFRHTFATQCLEKGMDLISIQTLLGHTDLRATQVYAESSMDNIKKQYKKIYS